MTTPPTSAASDDLGQFTVKELQERAAHAFQQGAVDTRHAMFERIAAALSDGAICGKPVRGRTAACMIHLLDRLGWAPSLDRFARAMPHFPDCFTATDLREVLGRLGFSSDEQSLRSEEIEPTRLPGLVLNAGSDPLIVTATSTGKIDLFDPVSGQHSDLPKRPVRIVTFQRMDIETPERPQSWMSQLARRFRPTLSILLGLTLIVNLMVIAISLAVMAIYDKVLPAQAMDTLLAIVAGVGIAFVAELWLRRIRARIIGHLAGRLEYLIGCGIFAKLIALPLDMVASVPLGSQISRLKQFETVRDLVAGALITVGLELPFVVLFAGVLFLVGGPLGFIPLALIAIYALIAAMIFPVIRRLSADASDQRSEQYRLALNTLTNLRTIRSLGCERLWLDRIGRMATDAARAKRRAQEANRFLSALSAATLPITGGATVILGAHLVMNEALTVGGLIACMIIIWRVITPIQQGMLLLSRYADLSRLVTQLDRLMRLQEERSNDDVQPHAVTGAIRLDRATFRYQRTIEPTLLGLTLSITPGELVAVSGSSGAGKSTLLRLILNLYQPQSGAVSIDGMNIRQLPVSTLRAAIGYVPQNPNFFHGTIAQNLRLAAPAARDADLNAVADELGMLPAINDLSQGFESRLDEFEQTHMAGGLRQQLAIMQALLRKPRILLLDEPVKALDPEAEHAFLDALLRRRGTTTIVMVTHRPSHIRMADRSIVLERGQIAHDGPPQGADARVSA